MNLNQFTQDGKFLMLALDHRESFKKLMNPQNPDSVLDEQAIQLKSEIIKALQDQFSGLLIDEIWGLEAYKRNLRAYALKDRTKPFLLPLEKSGYEEVEGERVTKLEYSVEQIKNLGASGAKLLVHFNPDAKSAKKQLATAKEVMEDCKQSDFPFFLEIVTYTPGVSIQIHPRGDNGGGGNLVLDSVRKFINESVIPDVWKLEYPGTSEECSDLSKMVGNTPWILLTGGQTFEEFKPELGVASQNGAKGFLAGRALWQEVCRLLGEEKQKFLKDTLPARFQELTQVARGY